jgi:hypothetical protein
MCGDTRPSVLWDNLTALQPVTMKDAQTALFLRKLPRHISNLINTRAFNTTEEMIQHCNALWISQTSEEAASAAAAAAVPSQQSSFRNSRRSPSPYRRKTSGGDKSGRRRSPTPGAAKGGRPSRSTALSITSTQVAPPPCSPALGGWIRRSTTSPKRSFSPWKKQVLSAAQIRLGRPCCTWFPRRMVVAPLRRLPLPERRHHTRQVPPSKHAVPQ